MYMYVSICVRMLRMYTHTQERCITCGVGSSSLSTCACDVGTTGPNGGPCVACPAGKYKGSVGSAPCSWCQPGLPATADRTSCLCGDPGKVWIDSACVCKPGFSPTAAGTAGAGSGGCEVCMAGKFKALSADLPCGPCASPEVMVPVPGAAACGCKPGYTVPSAPAGSTSPLPPGRSPRLMYVYIYTCTCTCTYACTYHIRIHVGMPDGGWCERCVAGKYKMTAGSEACVACPANSHSGPGSNTPGACKCNAGHTPHTRRGHSGHLHACEPCAAGTFKPAPGPASCSACGGCAPGSARRDCGLANPGRCDTCPAGTWKEGAGSQVCRACHDNANSPAGSTAQSACVCNAGHTAGGGFGVCSRCAAGTYKALPGPGACAKCRANSYGAISGAVSSQACASCPTNAVAPEGSSSPDACQCKAGYEPVFTILGVTGCQVCPPGAFSNAADNGRCEVCPPGKASKAEGAASALACAACAPGRYQVSFPHPRPARRSSVRVPHASLAVPC